MMGNMGSFISVAVAVPFVIVALVLGFIGLRQRARVNATKAWPTVSGQVLHSTVEARRSHSSEGGYSTSYYPVVVYQYQVNGRAYQSNQINAGSPIGRGSQRFVEQYVAENYAPGAVVQVYYDPENPQQAVLEHKATSGNILLIVAVVIVVILVVTMAFTLGITNAVTNMIPKF